MPAFPQPGVPDEASHPDTSAQRLTKLSAQPALRPLVAANPAAPAPLLARLAWDRDAQVREAVAGNPTTPWPTLEGLAGEFPHAFLHHPAGPVHLLAHPEQITTDEGFWEELLRVAPIPSGWWNWLKSHPALSACEAMRLHVQEAGETTHPYGAAQETDAYELSILGELLSLACERHVSLPPLVGAPPAGGVLTSCEQVLVEHLHWLAQAADFEIRAAVARNARTPEAVLQALAQDEHAGVRQAVAQHEQVPEQVLQALAQDEGAEVRAAVARHTKLPEDLFRVLATDEGRKVRQAVASNDRTPPDLLHRLAEDKDADVREAVAKHPQALVDMLRLLAQDGDEGVRLAVAKHAHTPPEVLHQLATDEESRVRWAVAENPHTPPDLLHRLAEDKDGDVQRAVALNDRTPLDLLDRLAHDGYSNVRQAVASNDRTPPDLLHWLAHDESPGVREAVAGNGRTPEQVLHTLTYDPSEVVRRQADLVLWLLSESEERLGEQEREQHLLSPLLARLNREWSIASLLEQVVNLSVSVPVRQQLLAHLAAEWGAAKIRTSLRVRAKRLEQALDGARTAARLLLTPELPPIALQKLAASPTWEVRYLVALHDQTPWETRQQLSQDGNRYVRAMAQAKAKLLGESAP